MRRRRCLRSRVFFIRDDDDLVIGERLRALASASARNSGRLLVGMTLLVAAAFASDAAAIGRERTHGEQVDRHLRNPAVLQFAGGVWCGRRRVRIGSEATARIWSCEDQTGEVIGA
jgi:hypothetical protein